MYEVKEQNETTRRWLLRWMVGVKQQVVRDMPKPKRTAAPDRHEKVVVEDDDFDAKSEDVVGLRANREDRKPHRGGEMTRSTA